MATIRMSDRERQLVDAMVKANWRPRRSLTGDFVFALTFATHPQYGSHLEFVYTITGIQLTVEPDPKVWTQRAKKAWEQFVRFVRSSFPPEYKIEIPGDDPDEAALGLAKAFASA